MDRRTEIREFLASRRARITPQQAGLIAYGRNRRVPGLRREEVALLAGVSIDYYTQLERGDARGVSDEVLEAIARALQLDEAERAHLFDLVRTAHTTGSAPSRAAQPGVRPSVQQILDAMTGAAAFVRNGRLDVLSANRLGYALYSEVVGFPPRPANLARFIFLDGRESGFYADRQGIEHAAVGSLRAEAGRNPGDAALADLIGELSAGSDEFRALWAAHNVRYYRSGVQPFRHALVGELALNYNALELPADPGQTMIVYSADAGSPAERALTQLASWPPSLE
ncbi:MAG TPA: helix-turn-helix transcriptional regulator [Streptosporangiaceae bacterium]|nr:helix-turn-helix transcriptional regulator [Streptosporangiaceae bacterium]